MARVANIQIEKDNQVRPVDVSINKKRHSECLPQDENSGALTINEFEKKYKEGISGDDLFGALHKKIEILFAKDDCL